MVSSTVKVLRKLWDSRPAQNLGEAANVKIVLAALSSGLQQNCSYAVDIICSMDGPQFKNAFLGARRTPTLACLACSVKTLAWDSSQSSLLLAKKLSLELDKTDLVASGLHSQLWPLHLNAPASTAALAKRIVGGSKDSEAARCRSSYSTCVPDMQHVFLRSNTELLCSLPLMPPPFDTATSNTVDGVSTSSKKRTKPKHSLEKDVVCLYCTNFCTEPDSVQKTVQCNGCMRSAHLSCCEEIITTHPDWEHEQVASKELVTRTSQLSYLLLTSLSELFPPKLAITVTAGGQDLSAAQAEIILPAAIGLLPEFHGDFRHVIVSGKRKQVMLIDAFVNRTHPMWAFNNVLMLTLWALPHASNDDHSLKGCLPVVTILFRIQGKDVADLLYAATDKDVRGCKLLQVAMLALQLHLHQMGVDRIFLDAASETAESVWCALGFSAMHPRDYKVLARQYCLVLNSDRYVAARCLKHIPHQVTLLEQVRRTTCRVPDNILALRQERQRQLALTYPTSTDHQPAEHQAKPDSQDRQLVQARVKRQCTATERIITSGAHLPTLLSSLNKA